ncbi:MAG: DUF1015 family protein [Lachnospiraceae bacterium]|nr:DUF1015 family protein [Lachnospiraceae bacterium]
MADLRSFRAFRPTRQQAATIAALPYDVYNREEATEVVSHNPKSFLAIDRAETGLPASVDTYADEVYERARDLLNTWIREGDFVQDEIPMYYLYALTMNGRTQHGFVTCASVDDYLNGVIKKHENTRAEKEVDRIRHVDTCSMQTGPIFLAYRQNEELKGLLSEILKKSPEVSFTSEDGITHEVWKVAEEDLVKRLRRAFRRLESIYIADGHHRCASAVKVALKRREEHPDFDGKEEFNFFLSVLFPEEELKILPYHRVLKSLNGHTVEQILSALNDHFTVTKIADATDPERTVQPTKKGTFAMYLEQCWYALTLTDPVDQSDPVKSLDVSILQDLVLSPVFGITDPQTDRNIDFVGGIRGIKELERRCASDCVCAFAMYPTDIRELFAVADAGRLMPPKSTWFEPKLRSGLFLHQI